MGDLLSRQLEIHWSLWLPQDTILLKKSFRKKHFFSKRLFQQNLANKLNIESPDHPSKNPERFVHAMLQQMEEDFENASNFIVPTFFDRGIPDLIAYAETFGIDSQEYEIQSELKKYNQKVFILSPWKEIFVNDELRTLTFQESLLFHKNWFGIMRNSTITLSKFQNHP